MRTSITISILALLLVGCATNPVTGRRQLSLYSEAQEIQMGRQELERARLETGFYPDSALTAYLADIGRRLAALSERPHLPWEFHIVDDPAVNAFAAPGGFIFFTRGILAHLNSEAELAGVMGHEIGHVTARHSVTSGSVQQLLGIGIAAGSMFNTEIAGMAGQVAGLGLLSYSRSHESQADELGHRYALTEKYDVRDMPNTFRTFERLSNAGGGGSGKLPAFLSTHPDPGSRVEKTQAWADTVTNTAALRSDRDRFYDRINGMVYGIDPQNGYFENTRFLHPVLRLRFDIPTGWQSVNQATRVVAVHPQGQAQLVLSFAEAQTVDAAAQAFAGQQGLTNVSVQRATVNGFAASVVSFAAATGEGQALRGEALFVPHQGQVLQFLGLATAAAWPTEGARVSQSLRSIAPTAANQVFRPRSYLRIITLTQPTTIEALAQRSEGAVTAAALAIMNGVAEGTTLPAGRRVKTVGR